MADKSKKLVKKKLPRFDLPESVKKLFPPVSTMGHTTPVPYDNRLFRQAKERGVEGQYFYSTGT